MSRLNPPLLNVQTSQSEYESRRNWLLEGAASSTKRGLFGARAIARLTLGRSAEEVSESNEDLRWVTGWFDRPHPEGRDHKGENDFAAMKLCHAYHLFEKSKTLEPETLACIRTFFLTQDLESMHHSENHGFLFHTSRYLMADTFSDDTFEFYGKTGRQLVVEEQEWLEAYLRYRGTRGWGEFDSACYIYPQIECLTALFDFAPNAIIRELAGKLLNLTLADMVVDSFHGLHGGAHGRIYAQHAHDHRTTSSYMLQYLYFGNVDVASLSSLPKGHGHVVDAATSTFRPDETVLQIALNRTEAYVNRERKHLHHTEDLRPHNPLDGSIRKYTYWTPQYILGAVQFQDPYPESAKGKWYAHHEQHQWDLTIGTRAGSRIFTHHPGKKGNEHGHWTGDLNCGCGHFFQHRSVVLALYDVPEKEPCQFIHAFIPKEAFDEVIDENGFIFIREGEVFAALKMLGEQSWTTDGEWKDKEVISQGGRNGAICEVGLKSEFKDFAAFRAEIASNELIFDRENLTLSYQSRSGKLFMDAEGTRNLDGQTIDLDYPYFDNPYMQSTWDSGVVKLREGSRELILDFNKDA